VPLPRALVLLLAGALLLRALPARAELWLWVDDEGRTHVTDDPKRIPARVAPHSADEAGLDVLWGGRVRGPEPPPASHDSSRPEDRAASLVRSALTDLRDGDFSRAAAELEGALRTDPHCVEAHWYLALLDRQRGRFDAAERHLEAFLAGAGDDLEAWRESARRRLAALADERRLAEAQAERGPLRLVAAESPHFRIQYDEHLGETAPDYARTVARYLEEAHDLVSRRLGVSPLERTGVVFYGKAAYLAAYKHRFSFPTVGFYDGRIHVASAAHPAGELRALLFHEYVHAVFAERVGGPRPFWLNEGLAELAERSARGQDPLSRVEKASLRRHIDDRSWLPLERLAPGFGGLDEASARLAYLESTAAAAWLQARAKPAQIAALLDRLGAGDGVDTALQRAFGVDTKGLDAAVRRDIEAEFAPTAG
jgi:tetratricopeptide (TPR) repeat protein